MPTPYMTLKVEKSFGNDNLIFGIPFCRNQVSCTPLIITNRMEYSKLVAVSGLPGLFELLNSKTDGAIIRSLEDKSTRFVASRVHSFSHLESIEIYTTRDNVNLVDVLNAMDKAGVNLPDEKDAAAVKKYFEKVYPDMDFERVYASDMKKMVKWFDQLKKNNVEIKLSEEPEEEPAAQDVQPHTVQAQNVQAEEVKAEPVAGETPKKKTTRKKKAE